MDVVLCSLNKAIISRIFMGVKYERLSYLLCIVSIHLLLTRGLYYHH